MSLIAPHGGQLIDRMIKGKERERWLQRAEQLQRVWLDARQLCDVEMIAVGAFSPLEGFMGKRNYESVLTSERLANGLPWTIPVTLAVTKEQVKRIGGAEAVALADPDNHIVAVLELEEIFPYDREQEALAVLGTTSESHPSVRYLQRAGDHCLGGRIGVLRRPDHNSFADHMLDPKETRFLFEHRGWRQVVAFQTRNPIHRAHEYILRCALETVDGLLLHPLVGETRNEDVPADVRLRCYLALLEVALPAERTVMSVYPAAMRYAGPREAVFHAIARKNYGCTHFVVGRDAAGVGNFYGAYDAQRKFLDFDSDELGIVPICFSMTFYCRKCEQMASEKTCKHGAEDRLVLSGTRVREMLSNGQDLPAEFTRPEVAEILRQSYFKQALQVTAGQ